MVLDVLSFLLSIQNSEVSVIEELTLVRDKFHEELQNQLNMNRILRNNEINSRKNRHFIENRLKLQPQNVIKIQDRERSQQPSVDIKAQFEQFVFRPEAEQQNQDILKRRIRTKNDTKNIPKNFGKAIIKFIQKSPKAKRLCQKLDVRYEDLVTSALEWKSQINTIEGLRKMWKNDTNNISKCIRILSYQFMRKHCFRYIFRSRVIQYDAHIKYRKKVIEGIQSPDSFNYIKTY